MKHHSTLHPMAMGVAFGVLWSVGILFLSLLATQGIADAWVNLIGNAYLGYHLSFGGVIIGMIWGFVDAFIGGYLFAWLYNYFVGKMK